ncbi:SRPBCC family protein [Nocardioides sp. MAHUQ-72]|uniref:SRPBCC family protein n=1 Tax=unclassified Nocardioides TaxID=2615069 RepID=UPI00361B20A6
MRGHIDIARPVEDVFDTVADQTREPTYNPGMVSSQQVTPGPVGEGSRFRAVARTAGREVPMTIELVDYLRPHHLGVLTSVDGTIIDGTIDFVPCAGGTRMCWDWDIRTTGRVRALGPLIGYLGRRQERRIWSSLKRQLERDGVRRE